MMYVLLFAILFICSGALELSYANNPNDVRSGDQKQLEEIIISPQTKFEQVKFNFKFYTMH